MCCSSNTKNRTSEKAEKVEKLSVALVNGNQYVSGQMVELQFDIDSTRKIDSAIVYIGAQRFKYENVVNFNVQLPIEKVNVGKQQIHVNAWFTDGQRAEGRTMITILSDIVPKIYTCKIIRQLPHNSTFYTQGFEFDGDYLYEGVGLEGRSGLYKFDFQQQKLVNSVSMPNQYFGEGITILGGKVYQLTWQNFTGFIYNKQTLNKIGEFVYNTEGWGLTNDGTNLIMSDGSEKIYFIDTTSLQEVKRIEVYDNKGAVLLLNELEYVDGLIYANIYCTDNIVVLNPENGKVLKYINMTGLLDKSRFHQHVDVLNGIAYQKSTNRWFVTGKLWPTIFQVEFVERK